MLLASAPAQAQAVTGKTPPPAGPPPDWEKTKAQIRELTFAGESQKVIAIVEPIVAARPRFAEGHARLGGAHESVARAVARKDPELALKHFDLAVTHLRHAFELGGGEYPESTIRGLIDLYDYPVPRPEMWKATVIDALARYPGVPAAHWYGIQLILREGRVADLDAAFRNARGALKAAEARLDYASLLVGLAERSAEPAVRSALVREALALADAAVKSSAGSRSIQRQADAIKADAARLQPK